MEFNFNFQAHKQAEAEAGQDWAQLREDAQKLAALNGCKEVVNIKCKTLFSQVIKNLGPNVAYNIPNPKPSHNEWERGAVTLQRTYFFYCPEQPKQPQKTAF